MWCALQTDAKAAITGADGLYRMLRKTLAVPKEAFYLPPGYHHQAGSSQQGATATPSKEELEKRVEAEQVDALLSGNRLLQHWLEPRS